MLVESILIWHMGLSKIGRFTPNNFGFTKIIGITVKRDINPSNYWPNCARVGPKMVDIQDTATLATLPGNVFQSKPLLYEWISPYFFTCQKSGGAFGFLQNLVSNFEDTYQIAMWTGKL